MILAEVTYHNVSMVAILVAAWLLLVVALAVSAKRVRRGRTSLKIGMVLVLSTGTALSLYEVGPPCFVRAVYGNYPLDRIPYGIVESGMTADEVRAAVGPPHESYLRNGELVWYYWLDAFGEGWVGVRFGRDGLVNYTWCN